jgi:RNA polymerase-binding transcription factor DksA
MPKKKDSKKPAKKVAPAAKAKVKPTAKPVAAKGKAPAPVKSVKNAPAPAKAAKAAPVAKGKAAKTVPVVAAKNTKGATAAPAAKGAKGAKAPKAPKVDHAVQKGLLNKHRDDHHQSDALVVAPRAKLQFYTILDLKAYLEKRNKSKIKLNVWVPDEERKAREKAAAAARSQGNRSNNIATASIADLLGGSNPFRKGEGFVDESKQVPEKFRRYYRLLVDMRDALHKGLAFHSEEALKKSGKDDAGDLSGYSQHLADAGTDTADRDFALSLISNEQEALKEIADAIERMKKGSYGTCEITNKPIPAARLIAVPFTRYSLEGQKELERNRRAHRRRGGNPLGEIGDEVGFGTGGGGGEDDPSDT